MPVAITSNQDKAYIHNGIFVYCGNSLDILRRVCRGHGVKLIFADPPFNIGQSYNGYVDKADWALYRNFLKGIMAECTIVCNGVMCFHGNDAMCEAYLESARLLGLKRIAWVNWHYRFGQCNRSNWIDARCHCLIYSTVSEHTWNPDDVLVDSDRVQYKDKRVHETDRGGKRLPGTVWGVPSDGPCWGRVQGTSIERREAHPNQLPEVYLERIIRAYTNPGDLVVDPFGGSGTTAVVAQALGRKCITIDISEENCRSIVARLKKGSVRL